jgi:hypothetical protein
MGHQADAIPSQEGGLEGSKVEPGFFYLMSFSFIRLRKLCWKINGCFHKWR